MSTSEQQNFRKSLIAYRKLHAKCDKWVKAQENGTLSADAAAEWNVFYPQLEPLSAQVFQQGEALGLSPRAIYSRIIRPRRGEGRKRDFFTFGMYSSRVPRQRGL